MVQRTIKKMWISRSLTVRVMQSLNTICLQNENRDRLSEVEPIDFG